MNKTLDARWVSVAAALLLASVALAVQVRDGVYISDIPGHGDNHELTFEGETLVDQELDGEMRSTKFLYNAACDTYERVIDPEVTPNAQPTSFRFEEIKGYCYSLYRIDPDDCSDDGRYIGTICPADV